MSHKSLLVLMSGVASAAGVVLGLTLLHVLVSAMADAAADDALGKRATPLVRAVTLGDLTRIEQDAYAQVVDEDGSVLARSPAAPAEPMLDARALAAARAASHSSDVQLPGLGEHARVRAVGVPGSQRVVAVAAPTDGLDIFTGRHLYVSGVLVPLLVLALVAGAARLVRATLRPVQWLTDEALAASSGRRRSIRTPPGDDEVAGLARALERMMARVRAVEDREHAIVADASRALRVPVGVLRGEIRHTMALTDLDDIRRSLRLASAETERLATLAGDLVVLAAERSGELDLDLEPVNVREAVVRTGRPLRTALGVSVAVGGDDALVYGDRLRLEQVVTYLVANSATAGAHRVQITIREEGASTVLDVEDDGPGFTTTVLPWAFEPFSRGQTTGTTRTAGAGLGLAVVAALVRAHGGSVTADNASSVGGARVSIRLPTATGPERDRDTAGGKALTLPASGSLAPTGGTTTPSS